MSTDRRRETTQRIERTRAKIEKFAEQNSDPTHQVFALGVLSLVDLLGDMGDKLHEVAEVQGVQTEVLAKHVSEEDSMLSRVRGAIWAFTIVGGALGALIVWVALGLVADVRETGNAVKRLQIDVATNSEKLKAQQPKAPVP